MHYLNCAIHGSSLTTNLEITLVDRPDELVEAIVPYWQSAVMGVDTETTGLDCHGDQLRTVQLAIASKDSAQSLVIDCKQFTPQDLEPLRELLHHSTAVKVFQGGQFDFNFLRKGLSPSSNPDSLNAFSPWGGKIFDTLLASQLVYQGYEMSHNLQSIALRELGVTLDKSEQKGFPRFSPLSPNQIIYAAIDAYILIPLRQKLLDQLVQKDLIPIAKIEFNAIRSTADMEWAGVGLNTAALNTYAAQLEARKLQVEARLRTDLPLSDRKSAALQMSFLDITQPQVNPGNDQEVLESLQSLGVPVTSTGEDVIKPFQSQFPVIGDILARRQCVKLLGTYVDKFPRLVNATTGRLHPHYFQNTTVTGRFSSKSPSLQQIPRDPLIKAALVPAPGRVFVEADYSQIELRILAQITRDPLMMQAYQQNVDLHRLTASLILNKPIELVTKDERQMAKAINFGVIYGIGAEGLVSYSKNSYGVTLTLSESCQFLELFFSKYKNVKAHHDQLKAEQPNFSRTLCGRLRQWHQDTAPFTEISNAAVQGSSADITKIALSHLPQQFQGTDAIVVLNVHDSIVSETSQQCAEEVAFRQVVTMIEAGERCLPDIPVQVDAGIQIDLAGTDRVPILLPPVSELQQERCTELAHIAHAYLDRIESNNFSASRYHLHRAHSNAPITVTDQHCHTTVLRERTKRQGALWKGQATLSDMQRFSLVKKKIIELKPPLAPPQAHRQSDRH